MRAPPSDLNAERSVLSSLFLDGALLDELQVASADFYHPAHATVLEAMQQQRDDGYPIDLTTVAARLDDLGKLDAAGGLGKLAELVDVEATPANAHYYAAIVRQHALRRQLIETATAIGERAYDEMEPAADLIAHAEQAVFALGQQHGRQSLESIEPAAHDALDHVERIMTRGADLTGLATPWAEVNALMGGLQPGELIVLAARPSMGKTACALDLVRHAVLEAEQPAVVFSLEMTTRALLLRMMAAESGVDLATLTKGYVSGDVHTRLSNAAERLSRSPLWLDESPSPTIAELRSRARRQAAKSGCALVVVDYLQLVRADADGIGREQAVASVTRGLKAMAKELDCPVVALSQLNRGPETRRVEDKRPMLADLRESGAIEQDADCVVFLYRDIVYNRATEHPDRAEWIVAKQRSGPIGTAALRWESRFTRFADWEEPREPMQGRFGGGAIWNDALS